MHKLRQCNGWLALSSIPIGLVLLLFTMASGFAQEQSDTEPVIEAENQAEHQAQLAEVYLDTFALEESLENGESVTDVANALLEDDYPPQLVAHAILQLQPEAATEVAVAMALHSPEEAPFVAAAISWMASSQPAPVAAAVAAAVPEMAPEVASHVAAAFPRQTAAVARAVAESLPDQLTTIARTMGTSVPEEAAAVIRGTAPLIDSPLEVVDFLVEMFAALPIPLAAFVEPRAGLVILSEGEAERLAAVEDPGSVVDEPAEAPTEPEPTATEALAGIPLGIAVGDGLPPGEQLTTGAEARLMMALRDGSILSVFDQSRLLMGGDLDPDGVDPPVATLEQGLIRIVGGEGKPRSWRIVLGSGSLVVAGADALLARGGQGIGVILLNGTAIWTDSAGQTRTLERGRYRGELSTGQLGPATAAANVYEWLADLGLESLQLGGLAEQSVWVADRLGRTIALGGNSEIQTP